MATLKEQVIQNIKVVKIMKSSGYTDREIGEYLGTDAKSLIDVIEGDGYLKEVYENAQAKLVTDIERRFLENVMGQLAAGENGDAKWILERTSKKYMKREQLDVTVKTIDEIIRESDE